MDWIAAVEIFAFITGLLYLYFEVKQKNVMWIVGILTGAACAASFAVQRIWASAGLNIYYVIVSFIGIYQWRKTKGESGSEAIVLRRLPFWVAVVSLAVLLTFSPLLSTLLARLGGNETLLDAGVTIMSAIATVWLAACYPQQWLLWIVADICSAVLCAVAGMYWMTVLYIGYAGVAVYGWFHWKSKGNYIE